MSHSFLRPDLSSLPAYVAGQPALDPAVIKVASNEMPFPTLPAVAAAITQRIGMLNRYPDMANEVLRSAIAAHHEVSIECVVVGNGSTALIEDVLTALCVPGDEVVIPWRSFEAYPIAIQVAGAQAVRVPLRDGGRLDLPRMAEAITDRTRAVLVCTPNNPTSTALTHSELAEFVRLVPEHIPVIIDEAYGDFLRMDDPVRGIELACNAPNVLSLRTFSKAYALAGIRVGYAVGAHELIRALHLVGTPFGVNMLAQSAAVAALQQREEVMRRCEVICSERDKLVAALRALGWKGPAPQGNFLWFATGEETARFERLCRAEGIIVRAFSDEGVRVTVAEPEASLRLVRAYKAFRASNAEENR
ncbi:histidinol-phosphate transaminase [Trueperella sp. LYQ143]